LLDPYYRGLYWIEALLDPFHSGAAPVAVGAGPGGAVLVGGNNNTVSLQPLSMQVEAGLNLSAGIGNLNLQYMPVTPPPPFRAKKHGAAQQ
jgi:Protein of unknown function (DUF992)